MMELDDTNGSTPVQSLGYYYDTANNLFLLADGVNSANSQIFAYDPLNA